MSWVLWKQNAAQWATWADDLTQGSMTDAVMGTQSEAELVSQSQVGLVFPFIRPSFRSLPPHESARQRGTNNWPPRRRRSFLFPVRKELRKAAFDEMILGLV